MKRKFSSETIYKVNAADDFVLDDETFDRKLFTRLLMFFQVCFVNSIICDDKKLQFY